jgi:glycosidase
MARLYDLFSQDFLLPKPLNVMVFADNHDITRFYNLLNGNIANYKLAMALLLTTRGIPQMYTGIEILMEGDQALGDGAMRKDFPGGWAGDIQNAYTQQGLSPEQVDVQNYVKRIQNWRKTNDAVRFGVMTQFVPDNGVYVYFRIKDDKAVMVVINNSIQKRELKLDRFAECIKSHKSGNEIITGKQISLSDKIEVKEKSAMIIALD